MISTLLALAYKEATQLARDSVKIRGLLLMQVMTFFMLARSSTSTSRDCRPCWSTRTIRRRAAISSRD
jgi:hypothetical protein